MTVIGNLEIGKSINDASNDTFAIKSVKDGTTYTLTLTVASLTADWIGTFNCSLHEAAGQASVVQSDDLPLSIELSADYCKKQDTYTQGGALDKSIDFTTYAACREECNNTDTCVIFTVETVPAGTDQCHLKDEDATEAATDDNYNTIRLSCLEDHPCWKKGYSLGTAGTLSTHAWTTVQACVDLCNTMSACVAITVQATTNKCVLMNNKFEEETAQSVVLSIRKSCYKEDACLSRGMGYTAGQMGDAVTFTTIEACFKECESTDGCEVFNTRGGTDNKCYLRGADRGEMVEDPISIAGELECYYKRPLANLTGQADRLANYSTTMRLSSTAVVTKLELQNKYNATVTTQSVSSWQSGGGLLFGVSFNLVLDGSQHNLNYTIYAEYTVSGATKVKRSGPILIWIVDVSQSDLMHRVAKESSYHITATFKNLIVGDNTTIVWNKVGGAVDSNHVTNTATSSSGQWVSKVVFISVSEDTVGSYWCSIVDMPSSGQMTAINTSLIEITIMNVSNISNAVAGTGVQGNFSAIINNVEWLPSQAEVKWDQTVTSYQAPLPQYYNGLRSCVMKGWHEVGTELKTIEDVSSEEYCREECAAETTCYSWVHTTPDGVCKLMEAVGGVTIKDTKTFGKKSWCDDYAENMVLNAHITSSSSESLADINNGIATGTLYAGIDEKLWIKIVFKHTARVNEMYVFTGDADSVVGTHISIGQAYTTSITTATTVYHWTATETYDAGMVYLENSHAGLTTGVNIQEIVIIGIYHSQQYQLTGVLPDQSISKDGTYYTATVEEPGQTISTDFKFTYIEAKRKSQEYSYQHSILHHTVALVCTFNSKALGKHWYPIDFYTSTEEDSSAHIHVKDMESLCWTPEETTSATYLSLNKCIDKSDHFFKTREGFVIHMATGLCLAPEDSGATISNATNLILSKDCTAQFTLSSNTIVYENGTINGNKPYVTNGYSPGRGSRAILVETCPVSAWCKFKYSTETVSNVTENFTREAVTADDGSTVITITTMLYVRTQFTGYKWCAGYFNGTAVETNKVNLERLKFDVPCLTDRTSGEVGQAVTFICIINANARFPTAMLPEISVATLPDDIALGNISMPEYYLPDTYHTDSVTFKTSNLDSDGFFVIKVAFPLTLEMSYKYLKLALNFTNLDFPGVLWTNPTLMIIASVNQTELSVAGVVGLPVAIKCYGVSETALSELRLYFINETSGKDELQDYDYDTIYDKAGDKTDFETTVTNLVFAKEGDYYCSVKMSGGTWTKSQTNTTVKVMGIIGPPPNVTASTKGRDASIICKVSYPELETPIPFTINWFLVGDDTALTPGPSYDFEEVLNGTGMTREAVSTLWIIGSPLVETFTCQVKYDGYDIYLNSTEALLVLLDVYMGYEVVTAPLYSRETYLKCYGIDVYYTQEVRWRKDGYLLSSDYQKFVTYYDPSIPATVAEIIFYDLLVSNDGNYTCEIYFPKRGLKLSSDRDSNERIRQSQLSVIYVTDEMDLYSFASSGYSIQLTCMLNLPHVFEPPGITWGLYYEANPGERIQAFRTKKEGVRNEEVIVDGETKYRSTFSTPALTLDDLYFRMEAEFFNLTYNGIINSQFTQIKYQYADLVTADYAAYPEANFFVLEGHDRDVKVMVYAGEQLDTDHAVWNYKRTTDTGWQTVFDNTTNIVQSLSTRSSDKTGGLIYATLTFTNVQRADNGMEINFIVYFNDSTSVEIASKPYLYVLYMDQYLLGEGFGRQNGIVKDVTAIFKMIDTTYSDFSFLSAEVTWYECETAALRQCTPISDEYCTSNICSSEDNYATYMTSITLKLNISRENNGKVYYAKISYPGLDVKPNSFTTGSITIVMLGACSFEKDLQWSQYPMSAYDLYDGTTGIVDTEVTTSQMYNFGVKIEVGAMMTFYVKSRPQLADIDSYTRIWLYCDDNFTPYILITIEELTTYVIETYNFDCSRGPPADTTTLSHSDEELEEGMIMLQVQFISQDFIIRAGTNEVKLPYTTTTINHKTDPITINEIEVKTGKHHVVFGALCMMQQGSKMDTSMTGEYHTGIPQIQWLNYWGVICRERFLMNEAKVWCDKNMVQFQHGGVPVDGLGYKKEDTWLSGLTCVYDDVDSVYDCENYGWANASCEIWEYAGVQCFTSGYEGITLVGTVQDGIGVVTEGELLIHYDAHWGGVCSWDLLTNDTATSMCIIMGLGKGYSYFGNTTQEFYWLDEIEAPGIVSTFEDMTHADWGRPHVDFLNFCNSSMAIYLKCKHLLQCYACESDNRETCMGTNVMQVLPKERSINLTSCNENTDYCYRFVRETENGTVRASYGCMESTPTYKETCSDMKRNLCRKGDKSCFCKSCVGSYCNHTPMYELGYFTMLFQRGICQQFLMNTRWLIYAIRVMMGDMAVISEILSLGTSTMDNTTFS